MEYPTIESAAEALRKGKVSSEELTREALNRVHELDPALKAFITVIEDEALAAARRADAELRQGQVRSPLHGIPVALKDVFCMAGVRTTCGSKIYADYVPDYDATVTRKLKEAGAIIIGKTNLHELAYGITSSNPHFGVVRNPFDLERIPGGSSGGSGAAVATGIVYMATGTDTGGSIRIPASFCGTVGLKPSFGRVSRYGILPLDYTLDHAGPLTRTVRDTALCMQVIAGFDPLDESSANLPVPNFLPPEEISLEGVRIGLPANGYFEFASPEVEEAVKKCARLAEEAGARVEVVNVPDIELANLAGRIILLAEASACFGRYLNQPELFGPDVLALLRQGALLSARDYIDAQRLRRLMRDEFRKLFETIDCLLTPTTPLTAPKIGKTTLEIAGQRLDTRILVTRNVRHANVLGLPALSLPCGFDDQKLPIGLQLLARPFEEPLLIKIGAAIEDRLGLAPMEPPAIETAQKGNG